jgi:flagellar biosynthesis/type III secretory pathway chaperone
MLASLYRTLIENLDDELKIHGHLLETIHEETQVLKKNRLHEIVEIGVAKDNALRHSEAAARRRMEIIAKIIRHLNLEEPVTFIQLAAYADPATRQELTGYREKFADIVGRIEDTNEINRQIIGATLAHVRNNLNFLNNISSLLPNYDQYGQIKAGNLQGRFISKAG